MDHLLTVDQVAELFQVHRETVRIWLRKGTLPGQRVGKRWFVSEDDVREVLKGKRGSEEAVAPASSGSHPVPAGGRSFSASAGGKVAPRIIG